MTVFGIPVLAARSARRLTTLLTAALMAGAAASCGDSTGPSHPALGIGETMEGELADAASVDSFSLTLAKQTPIVVILEPLGGRLTLRVTDSQGRTVGQVTGDGSGASAELATRLITTPVGDRYLVRVSVPTGGTPSEYRVHVIQSVIGPERIGDVIAAGDTIVGESLEHADDVDDFWVEAPAGAQIQAYIRTPGATPGSARLQVLLSGTVPTATSAGLDENFEDGTPAEFTALAGGRTYFRVTTTELGRGRPEWPLWYELYFHVVEPTP